MAKYVLGDKEVTEEEFNRLIKSAPFFLDEVLTAYIDMSKSKGNNVFEGVKFKNKHLTEEERAKVDLLRQLIYDKDGKKYNNEEDVIIFNLTDKGEEELESILKRDMSIGAPDWSQNDTGGTVFERVQDSNLTENPTEEHISKTWLYIPGSKTYKSAPLEGDSTIYKFKYEDPEEKSINNFCDNVKAINQNKEGKGINDMSYYPFPAKNFFENVKIGKKETENKTDYSEIDWKFITQLAERMNKNKDKYEPGNWKKELDVDLLKQSLLRHVLSVLNGQYEDDGRPQGHLEAIALNAQMINYQLKMKNKNE